MRIRQLRAARRAIAQSLGPAAFAAAALSGSATLGQDPRAGFMGRQVYQQYCAVCHGGADERAPGLEALQLMGSETVTAALSEGGLMTAQGAMLTDEQRAQVIAFLAAEPEDNSWLEAMTCPAEEREVDLSGTVAMARPGVNADASRSLTAEQAGLSREEMDDLELAWAIGFPRTSQFRGAPVIIGDTMFMPAGGTGYIVALDTREGCAKWGYDTGGRMRTSLSYGPLQEGGPEALVFADGVGQVHALDPANGEAIWVAPGRAPDSGGGVSGSIALGGGVIIVPISGSGVGAGGRPADYECCTGRGGVVALDAATGAQLWVWHTVPEADFHGLYNSAGARILGPSGAPIWSNPTIDAERGVAYVTTGENTSPPATDTSDAIIALDLHTGEVLWKFQGVANDIWTTSCPSLGGSQIGPHCVVDENGVPVGGDFDFGSAPTFATTDGGRNLVLAGQKSGHLWAIDRDDEGALVWSQRVGPGTTVGGNHWGIAHDGERVYLPINDPWYDFIPDHERRPGLYAFDIDTGVPLWSHHSLPDCSGERAERFAECDKRYGMSATPLVVDSAVIEGAVDGRLYVFDGETGEELFFFDALRDFETLNGVEASGGAFDALTIAAGDGAIFVGAGYGSFRQPRGNVLLAFRPREE